MHLPVCTCFTLNGLFDPLFNRTGKPVWVAWTLKDDMSATLRGGQPLAAALQAIEGVHGVHGVLVNCCAPQVRVDVRK